MKTATTKAVKTVVKTVSAKTAKTVVKKVVKKAAKKAATKAAKKVAKTTVRKTAKKVAKKVADKVAPSAPAESEVGVSAPPRSAVVEARRATIAKTRKPVDATTVVDADDEAGQIALAREVKRAEAAAAKALAAKTAAAKTAAKKAAAAKSATTPRRRGPSGVTRNAVDRQDDPPPDTGVALIDRVTGAIEREIRQIETIVGGHHLKPKQRTEAERRARTLASLTRTLAELRRLRANEQMQRAIDDDAIPRDLDELRRALSRRLDRMVDETADASAAGDE